MHSKQTKNGLSGCLGEVIQSICLALLDFEPLDSHCSSVPLTPLITQVLPCMRLISAPCCRLIKTPASMGLALKLNLIEVSFACENGLKIRYEEIDVIYD